MHGACYMDENGHNTIPSRTLWNRKQKDESSFHFPHTSSSICPFVLTQAWRGTPTAVSLGQTHSPYTSHSCFLLLSPPVLIFLSLSLRCHLSFPLRGSHPLFTHCHPAFVPFCTSCLCFPATLPSPKCSACYVDPLLAFVTQHSFASMEQVSLKQWQPTMFTDMQFAIKQL